MQIQPNNITFLSILPACGDIGALTKGKEIHSHLTKRGTPIDDFLGASLISMYSKCEDFDQAVAVFQEMRAKGSNGLSSWNAIIGCHVKQGNSKKALALFDEMLSAGIHPDKMTCSVVLSACGDVGALVRGKEIDSLLTKRGIPIGDYLGASLISMYSKCEDFDQAVAVFQEMHATRSTLKGRSCWNAIIGAFAKQGNSKKALALFDEMLSAGIHPDKKMTCSVVLSACGDIGALVRGKEIHSLITKMGIPIGDYLGASLISMYSKCEDFDQAVAVFQEMHAKGCTLKGLSSWNAIISSHVKQGNSKKALALFDEMLSAGNHPDTTTCSVVLSACGDIGALPRGKEIHSLIIKRGIPIDDLLGAALISMYSKCGDLDQALVCLIRCKQGLQIGVNSWNAIIGPISSKESARRHWPCLMRCFLHRCS